MNQTFIMVYFNVIQVNYENTNGLYIQSDLNITAVTLAINLEVLFYYYYFIVTMATLRRGTYLRRLPENNTVNNPVYYRNLNITITDGLECLKGRMW